MAKFKVTTLDVEGETEEEIEMDSNSKEFKELFSEDLDNLDGWTNGWISVEKMDS